ncbi:MAG: hypothetical protein M3018_03385 [Actinomycetota bacterium]|nr:hypothetical protein [Actinomycetota bacterium]
MGNFVVSAVTPAQIPSIFCFHAAGVRGVDEAALDVVAPAPAVVVAPVLELLLLEPQPASSAALALAAINM